MCPVVWDGFCLPLGPSGASFPHLVRSPPLRLDPGLAYFGGWWGEPVFPVCLWSGGCQHQRPGCQALTPEVVSLEEAVCVPVCLPGLLLALFVRQRLAATRFLRLEPFPSRHVFSPHGFHGRKQPPGAERAGPGHPRSGLPPPRFCRVLALLLLTALGFSPCRYWDKEVSRAEKDSRKPSLTKAIIKCYWKSYLVLGIFTLIEVKAFTCGAWVFRVCGWGRRWAALCGEWASP